MTVFGPDLIVSTPVVLVGSPALLVWHRNLTSTLNHAGDELNENRSVT